MGDTLNIVMAIVSIAVGLPLCFAGYRFFRASSFIIALMSCGWYLAFLTSYLLDAIPGDQTEYWAMYFGSGLLIGAIAALHTKSGICITGFCAGIQLASLFMSMFNYSGSYEPYFIWVGATGVVCGILTCILKKPALILGASLVGSRIFVDGIYYFLVKATFENASASTIDDLVNDIRTKWWIMCAISLALIAIGTPTQFLVTGRGNYHESAEQQQQQQQNEGNPGAVQYGKVETPLENRARVVGEPIAFV